MKGFGVWRMDDRIPPKWGPSEVEKGRLELGCGVTLGSGEAEMAECRPMTSSEMHSRKVALALGWWKWPGVAGWDGEELASLCGAGLMWVLPPLQMCQMPLRPPRSAMWARTPAPCSGSRLPTTADSRSWVSTGAQGSAKGAVPECLGP